MWRSARGYVCCHRWRWCKVWRINRTNAMERRKASQKCSWRTCCSSMSYHLILSVRFYCSKGNEENKRRTTACMKVNNEELTKDMGKPNFFVVWWVHPTATRLKAALELWTLLIAMYHVYSVVHQTFDILPSFVTVGESLSASRLHSSPAPSKFAVWCDANNWRRL